jgi:hypothetical protein
VRPEAEGYDTSLVGLVDGSELFGKLGLGDVGSARVKDINDELASGQETVGNEFARADGYWGVGLNGKLVSICWPI